MSNWAIMFVDMIDSTEFKYKYEDRVEETFRDLYALIRDNYEGNWMKSTGDGAMCIFRHDNSRNGCQRALLSAQRILRAVEKRNLTFNYPAIRLRVGIASGECYEVSETGPELSGTRVDLAARLCQETEPETILVDEATKIESKLPYYRFSKCDRPLSLKGIPRHESQQEYFYFKQDRLLRTAKGDNFSKGLLALYTDRAALRRNFSPARWIALACPNESILVAGRTMFYWRSYRTEMQMAAREKNLKFNFLVSSEESRKFIEQDQRVLIEDHWPRTMPIFSDLVSEDPEHFQVRIVDHLFLDGIVCCKVLLPDDGFGNHVNKATPKLLAIQDINAASGEEKASLLFACTCNRTDEVGDIKCKAHGLYRRTLFIFNATETQPVTGTSTPLERILIRGDEGLPGRNNHPSAYLHRVIPYFKAIRDDKLNSVPPPICVQLQISSKCSTDCVMCHHHLPNQRKSELSMEQWKATIESLAKFGVKSIIFSGGEPLMQPDIAELLDFAGAHHLAIGMLTNGTMLHKDEENRHRVIDAIRRNVTWVAISIDGTPQEDQWIRNPAVEQRVDLLKEFVDGLKDDGPILSATVTLQNRNIQMDLGEAASFIGKLGISRVNFKLATGARDALESKPKYLLSKTELEAFLNSLWNHPFEQVKDPENNLAYLRRCFASGIFNEDDATNGAPLRSFYSETSTRCFTPFLFSLIDSDGEVYTCCHLYRDNHGADKKSAKFRELHSLGNIQAFDFQLEAVWNGQRYSDERKNLARINPNDIHFTPCGECTRHCQHNRGLTEIYNAYQDNLDELTKLALDLKKDEQNVWF